MDQEASYGFAPTEFEERVARAQRLMGQHRLDGLLLTSMDNIRYFIGVDSTFWESYTRPWFVLIPATGAPLAIIPEIGRAIIEKTWVKEIRSWPSPRPEDEGTSLVVEAISGLPRRHGRVGAELGFELRLGIPVTQLNAISGGLKSVEIIDGASLIWQLRMIKSPAEISKIQQAIDIAGAVYAQVPDFVKVGDTERMILREFRGRLNAGGAGAIPTLICRSDVGGPFEITGGPRDRPIADGDLLFIDTGTTFDGYFCDYDRNYQIGRATDALRYAQEKVWEAHETGLQAVRAGLTAGFVFEQMAKALSSRGADLNSNGRMGHGLGLRLTEPPSIRLEDETVLQPGMVLCIEPALEYEPGKIVLHEETVVVTEGKAQLLTDRAPKQLAQIC
ncbi:MULTISPECIES: Xaa-Pro peptidase family protein [unclassified Mesorhizobium]|uniref:M24 family metallopeptidase n=1 Tax=unclassified Mesorhizobium TaxID=325217 RepID=UPI000FCA0071|nr:MULTISPECIES: Xaa-Pro peptidase family protein [unclassified Mesorhizobium]RUX07945.1 aminopeptidase P family protein [Mesorhizobium sp. M8A.F.Ca.ET.023.01.1.1]RVD51728.1 aminopeptidase P family protein [Mesorhizobium sp. M8A.F.Ca.ET.023.02.2.1]TGR36943.1 aminopeptidase P family protein [bacterium M00.F.Ca.ET.199.01.1.1]TGU17900.1 aminopeptidase P family protein [bacterium M00.F.Ca.ET.156.01.1.1]TGV82123.1 aminopeptidase P family protein [Mesorhizobium sp. M00.F.Ca.ET.149.01.1.1]